MALQIISSLHCDLLQSQAAAMQTYIKLSTLRANPTSQEGKSVHCDRKASNRLIQLLTDMSSYTEEVSMEHKCANRHAMAWGQKMDAKVHDEEYDNDDSDDDDDDDDDDDPDQPMADYEGDNDWDD